LDVEEGAVLGEQRLVEAECLADALLVRGHLDRRQIVAAGRERGSW
jgi:hypothetical protein